jgi:hypothetical protein
MSSYRTSRWLVTSLYCNSLIFFRKDLNGAESKEDILVLLTNISNRFDEQDETGLDRDMREGTAEALAWGLNQRLLLRPIFSRKYYRKSLEATRGLKVSVLCRVLELLLVHCSDQVLQESMHKLKDDLMPSLSVLLHIFACWEGESIIRLVTLASSIRLIRRIGPLLPEAAASLVAALLSLLNGNFPSDIRVDAASAAAAFLDNKNGSEQVVNIVEKDASVVISILSTAALAASNECLGEIMHGLSCMAGCPTLGSKLARRRCAVLAVVKHLSHQGREVRSKSLDLCHAFLGYHSTTTPVRTVLECNASLIVGALIKAVAVESDSRLQLSQIRILNGLITRDDIPKEKKRNVMAVLYTLVKNEGPDGPTMEAALCYLQSATPMGLTEEVLRTIADFTTSEYAKVRSKALSLLKDISFWHPHASRILLDTTDLLENFSLIISHGSDVDCADAIQACKQLVSDESHHQAFCIDFGFVTALVRLVTTEPVANRPAFIGGIDTIITLMSTDENLQYFLPFVEVLPWLVTFANRTCDDEIKEMVVSTIIRFSTAILM